MNNLEGLSVEFVASGARLDFSSRVSGFGTLAQNGLVNIGTVRGSDPVFPDRGTRLYRSGVVGEITNYNTAYHASNFAAMDTMFFLRRSDYVDSTHERIKTVKLQPVEFVGTRMRLQARFEGDAGSAIGKDVVN